MPNIHTRSRPSNLGLQAHPEEYREWAYQLWAFCGLKPAEIARRIATPEAGDPHPARAIEVSTVFTWKRRDDWAVRRRTELKAIAPDLFEAIMANLLLAANENAQFLLQLANGTVPLWTAEQIGAARVRVEAAKLAFPLAGFIPWQGTTDRSAPTPPSRVTDGSLADLDEDQLIQKWYPQLPEQVAPALDEADGDDS